jgi:tetratricopeptide (TPR) repeat protein
MKRQQKRRVAPPAQPLIKPLQNNVSDVIRSAEKCLSEGRYDLALEQLHRARDLDPANQYIDAIIVRAENLRATHVNPAQGRDPALEGTRYLSVTVGKEFSGGIRPAEAQSSEQIRLQIRQLTDTATVLLSRGLNESAFDSLMRAYLLDPMNPDVIACEAHVLPVWERTRASHSSTASRRQGSDRRNDSGSAGGESPQRFGLNLLKTLRGKA